MDDFECEPITAQQNRVRSGQGDWLPIEHETEFDNDTPDDRSGQSSRDNTPSRWATGQNWTPEIIACIFILAALFAMVATARYFNNKPLPRWRLHISINALYSVFASIFEGFLLFVLVSVLSQTQWHWFAGQKRSLYDVVRFNDASRGALGAFIWLGTKRLQQPLTAFASIVIILALGSNTFIQQLINSKDCSIDLPGNATILRTNLFNPKTTHIEAGPWNYPNTQEMTALVSGLLSSPNDVEVGCSSGNCTFSTMYSTLGYCSTCTDISDRLQFDGDCTETNCTIVSRLPSGLSISFAGNRELNLMAMSGVEGSRSEYEILVGRNSLTEAHLDPNGQVKNIGCENTGPDAPWLCRGYGAASCTLSACIRTYNATVSAGRLEETLIQNSPPYVGWDWNEASNEFAAVIDTNCITVDEVKQLRAANYTWNSTSRYIAYNSTLWSSETQAFGGWIPTPNSSFPQSMATHDCVYILSPYFISGFDKFFMNNSVFAGTLSATPLDESAGLGPFNGSQVLQNFYNNSYCDLDTINAIFQNAATTFTNHIRQNGNANYSHFANGTISHYATCVSVHWPWIALPAVLAACTIVLLVLVIVKTEMDGLPAWKGSLLPVIFQGPVGSEWLRKQRDKSFSLFGQDGLLDVERIERMAKGIRVQLKKDGGEPGLCVVKDWTEMRDYEGLEDGLPGLEVMTALSPIDMGLSVRERSE